MWKPPQRIKHPLLEARWPSREQALDSRLFSPIEVGPMTLAERTWVPAMVPWRATEEGFVTPEVLAWYEQLARGQPGALVVEATGIRDVPSGPLLRIGHDRFLPGLEELVQTVQRASEGRTRLLIQIIDFLTIRRRPEREKFFLRYLPLDEGHRRVAASRAGRSMEEMSDDEVRRAWLDLPREELEAVLSPRDLESLDFGYRERVTDLEKPHIRELPAVLPGLFADAASRARRVGFDGVELHFAHAYTMASFLSARNDRDDGYGGSLQGRLRLPLEVLRAVRRAVGDTFGVGCRMLSEECIEGGSTVDDTRFFACELAAAGLDFLSLSRGGKFEDAKQPKIGRSAYPYTGPSGYECMPTAISDEQGPFGRNRQPVVRIRSALRDAGLETPVVLSGGMSTFDQAESALRSEEADIIGAARQSLADPDWFRKMRLGRGQEIRRCIFTNYCEGLDQMHKQVTCQLWDRLDLGDPDVVFSSDGKRRLTAPLWKLDESDEGSAEPAAG